MLLVLLVIVNVCCGIELYGAEDPNLKASHRCVEKHKPLPNAFFPHRYKIVGHVNIPLRPTLEIITVTKTMVAETTKRLNKQPVCVKAHQRVSNCHSNTPIQATSVLQTPPQETAKVLGTLEKPKDDCDTLTEVQNRAQQAREGRHILPLKHFNPQSIQFVIQKVETATETITVTKVEEYVDDLVTATLIAENCIPVNEGMPRCPVKVEDYDDAYKQGIEHFSILGKEESDRRIDDDMNVSDERTYFNSSLLFPL